MAVNKLPESVMQYYWKGDKEGFEKAKTEYLNNSYNAGQLNEVTVSPSSSNWTSEDINNPIYKKEPKTIYIAEHQFAPKESDFSKIAGTAIGLPLTGVVGSILGPALLEGPVEGAATFREAHPFIATGIDVGLAADAAKNALSNEGIQKTWRLAKDGNYGRAALSGLGDILDLAGTADLIRIGSKIANPAYRAAWAYHSIPHFGYQDTRKRVKTWVGNMLSGKTPDVNKEASWVSDLNKQTSNSIGHQLYALSSENPIAAAEIFSRGRDEASRLYHGLPTKHNYYIKNADGSYRYNLDQIQKDWEILSGKTEYPLGGQYFFPDKYESPGRHGFDVITGAGGYLTKNQQLWSDVIKNNPFDQKIIGTKLIEDMQDIHPFRRKERYISSLLQQALKDKQQSIIKGANNLYTSIFNKLGDGKLNKFWYNYLGGKQLNQLRYSQPWLLPGLKIDKTTLDIVPNNFWKKLDSKMADFEMGSVTGSKPFLMRTEVPYTYQRKMIFYDDMPSIRTRTILGHKYPTYSTVTPKRKGGKLNYITLCKNR